MLIVIIVLIFSFLSSLIILVFLIDSIFGGLDFATNQAAINQVIDIIKSRHLENCNFYDLGSCRGGFALRIAKGLPNLRVLGVDNSLYRTLLAKTRGVFLKNLTFKRGDIFKTNVSDVNVVYLYLPQEVMPGLQAKLQEELKPGSLVISASVSFPNWRPFKIYDLPKAEFVVPKLFVYKHE